ncbi:unnamed protein product [Dicrocoelium dendriticum]|nr:unnamed protein product [Dicrocoelium dendriticum]
MKMRPYFKSLYDYLVFIDGLDCMGPRFASVTTGTRRIFFSPHNRMTLLFVAGNPDSLAEFTFYYSEAEKEDHEEYKRTTTETDDPNYLELLSELLDYGNLLCVVIFSYML